jgi:hypothetical protein
MRGEIEMSIPQTSILPQYLRLVWLEVEPINPYGLISLSPFGLAVYLMTTHSVNDKSERRTLYFCQLLLNFAIHAYKVMFLRTKSSTLYFTNFLSTYNVSYFIIVHLRRYIKIFSFELFNFENNNANKKRCRD